MVRQMGKRMAPAAQPLPDDLIPDILLRLPSDDPAGIVRASAVCKAWRRIITDPAFAGRYRALHPMAAVLGFLHRPGKRKLPRFVSTTSFRPAAADHRQHPLDCRHGRAVFYDYGSIGSYVVWDPATGELHKLPPVAQGDDYLSHPAVVCAAVDGCDHRGCSGGPFIVAFVGLEHISYDDGEDEDEDETTDEDGEDDDDSPSIYAHACFYASDTDEVDGYIDIHLGEGQYYLGERPAALVGDSLYFVCRPRGILRYRYGLQRGLDTMGMISAGIKESDVLSMMELPSEDHLRIGKSTDVVVMEAEGGGLGLTYLCANKTAGTMLYLLAMETDDATAAGSSRWVQRRVIDLKTLLPVGNNPKRRPCFRGVSQEANVIFVSTEDGVFRIDLGSSLQVRKVCEMGIVVSWMYPFVSFYTESLLLKLASSKLPALVGNQ